MFSIGNIKIASPAVMAPLAGISNLPFRIIAKRHGASIVFSEMISSEGLVRNQPATFSYLNSCHEEQPLAVQIFGSDPDTIGNGALIAIENGAKIIDINMGCPVRKVVKTGAGGAILREPDRMAAIISAVRKRCNIPITVKIRAGWSQGFPPDTVKLAKIAEDNGADGIIIHARFVSQAFSGKADWSIIASVKKALNIPVIGNGDVCFPADAINMINETGCDGVMIGRCAIGNPWIFKQINNIINGLEPEIPSIRDRYNTIKEHFGLLCGYIGSKHAVRIFRGLLLWYTKGLPHSGNFRRSFISIQDHAAMFDLLEDYFKFLKENSNDN